MVLAPEIVTAETVKSALEPILKMLKLRLASPLSPLIVSVAEPGPAMLKEPLFAMVSNALPAKVITPGPPAKSGSNRGARRLWTSRDGPQALNGDDVDRVAESLEVTGIVGG